MKCSICKGFGFWAIGQPNPIGEMDSKELPSFKCPECRQGKLSMPEEMKAFYLRQSKDRRAK